MQFTSQGSGRFLVKDRARRESKAYEQLGRNEVLVVKLQDLFDVREWQEA